MGKQRQSRKAKVKQLGVKRLSVDATQQVRGGAVPGNESKVGDTGKVAKGNAL